MWQGWLVRYISDILTHPEVYIAMISKKLV